MPVNLAKQNANVGEVIYQWKVKEYDKHERDKRWYLVMGIGAVLLLTLGVATSNYLFVLVVVLFGIILFLHGMQPPMEVNFAITQTGIAVGNKYYRYSELENFWIIYNPPAVKSLYFSFNKVLKHRLQIPLYNNDPRPIRTFLGQYLAEDLDQEEEPLSDRIARLFRLY